MDPKSFDLKDLDTTRGAEAGFTLTLTHPKTGDDLPARITVLGADSDTYREKQRAFQRKRLDKMNRARKFTVSPEEVEAEALELLVAVTQRIDWGGMTLEGQAPPADARAIYGRFGWIREQVDAAVQDRANFLPRSATS